MKLNFYLTILNLKFNYLNQQYSTDLNYHIEKYNFKKYLFILLQYLIKKYLKSNNQNLITTP
jgi:hypothetical protein